LPPGIAKKLFETPVITSVAPQAPPFRKDLARALRVEPVLERVRNEKLKFRDERQGNEARGSEQSAMDASRNQQDAARKQQMVELAAKAAQGNRERGGRCNSLNRSKENSNSRCRKRSVCHNRRNESNRDNRRRVSE
jgi:hypothetical protein